MPNAQRIGISGGTFDPIHMGHLVAAEEIRTAMKLDRVIFIPSGNPPHKKGMNVTDAENRLEMVTMATSGNPYFEVSDMEVKRGGYTYTVDTLTELRSGPLKNSKIYFITGADVIHELLTWKDYKKVFTLCEFIAVLRPGYSNDCFLESIKELHEDLGAIIHTVEAPLIGISSTAIRERVRQGRSIKYLVPEKVEEYIYSHRLYGVKSKG